MLAELVFIFALETNSPMYVHEAGPPYKESGVRLELHKPLDYGFYFDLNPYIWNAGQDRIGNGGVIFKLGWMGDRFGVQFFHQSEHNFDRPSKNGHIEFDAIELRWRLN